MTQPPPQRQFQPGGERRAARARLQRLWRQLRPRGLAVTVLLVSVLAGLLVFWVHFEPGAFAEWKREAGPVPFFIALAVLPTIGVPPTPFFILAGATFPVWVNLLGIGLALAANVILAYLLAHGLLRTWTERLFARAGLRLPDPRSRHALRNALLLKLAPGVPMALKNYLVALSGIGFSRYFAICFGISAVYAVVFVYLGDSLSEPRPGNLLLALFLLLVLVFGFWLVRHRIDGEVDAEAPSVAAGDQIPPPTGQAPTPAQPAAGPAQETLVTPRTDPGR